MHLIVPFALELFYKLLPRNSILANNIENCAYGSTMCAKANVLGSFISDNNPIGAQVNLYLNSFEASFASLCGNCRPIIAEFVHFDSLVITFNKQGQTKRLLSSSLSNCCFV